MQPGSQETVKRRFKPPGRTARRPFPAGHALPTILIGQVGLGEHFDDNLTTTRP